MLTILAVGEDMDLLRTRADVLRKTGANVLCSSGATALKFIAEWEFDLVVLGHTVRQLDAEQISEAAHRQGSRSLVLLLTADRMQDREYTGVDMDASSFVDPACLIRSATGLLELQQSRHRSEIDSNTPWKPPVTKKRPASYPADISVRRALLKSLKIARLASVCRLAGKIPIALPSNYFIEGPQAARFDSHPLTCLDRIAGVPMSRILLVGNDFQLLTTRAAVLARTMASVICCNMVEATRILQGESFDLVVLCHSLTEKQIAEITEMTHRKLPTARILRVISDISQELPADTAFDATSSSEPGSLIRRTSEMLRPDAQSGPVGSQQES